MQIPEIQVNTKISYGRALRSLTKLYILFSLL